MNDEEARRFQEEWLAARPPWGEQDENGIDLGHLRANLKLTPTERIEKLQRHLEVVAEVRRAAYDAGLRPTP